MAVLIAEHELFHSCRVLFGEELQVTRSFLEYLQLSGIKSAYRKKAFETHPDTLAGKSEATKRQSSDLFHIIQQAYENLTSYLDARERGFSFQTTSPPPSSRPSAQSHPASRPPRTAQKAKPAASAQPHYSRGPKKTEGWQSARAWRKTSQTKTSAAGFHNQRHYQGSMPSRKLLFGHYLYYCGITDWQTIIKALVWQRTQRPRVGEIGKRFGWLNNADILTILRKRNLADSFGKSAVSLGLLTERQLSLIIFQQKKLQSKFGEYFTANNILTPTQLNQLIRQFENHNRAISASRHAYAAG